ncbi:hypothetical protein ACGFY3_26815 [Streptomyces mirabilis]|uniref:hypothetical protein n=1 Tax=Streptomyces mirabilis TaxID=68239 RepID=UPI00371B9451
MKTAMVGVVAAGVFLVGAGTPMVGSWHKLPRLTPTGAQFAQGQYRFNETAQNHGSFEWSGQLKDALPGDNNNVYMLVRVEGHDWVRYNGKQRQTVFLHHSNWDGAQQYTDDADLRACRDRGTLRPDNCSPTRHFRP